MPQLTTLDADSWMIDDGELAHAESPDTFWIPPLSERQSLRPGDFAKIRFYIRTIDESGDTSDFGERMWVKVLNVEDGWYHGELDNQPHCTDAIEPGLKVCFQPRHVIDIDRFDSE